MSESRRAIILDSLRGTRHLDNTRSEPVSLQIVEARRTVLDWILHGLAAQQADGVTFVGGYHIEKVIQRYPALSFRFHARWQTEGELAALRQANPSSGAGYFVIRSRTLFLPEALERLACHKEIAVACYQAPEGQVFAGFIWLPAQIAGCAFELADTLARENPFANLNEWLRAFRQSAIPFTEVNLDGLAAPVSDRSAIARTVFGSKARALDQVGPLLKSAVVLDQVRFRVVVWKQNPHALYAKIAAVFGQANVVIRSSAYAEDGLLSSAAGRFRTVLEVPASDAEKIREAIAQVAQSYVEKGRPAHDEDEIFVQKQITGLAASGVLLTRDMETGAPYWVLNIDRHSGQSNVVTSGSAASFDSFYIARSADVSALPSDTRAAVELGLELQELTYLDALDIEFGIDCAGKNYLFQVRPISDSARKFDLADDDLADELRQVQEFVTGVLQPHAFLHGDTNVLGNMPDWNPAEMIGTTPRSLALSLYQRLIGDHAWAAARAQIGYKDVRPEPLIVSLCGQPYVDVRASLNSFLPKDLADEIARPWVNYGLRLLRDAPHLHDKIEFEVAITCLAFDFDAHAQRLRAAGLSEDTIKEFRTCLLTLTDSVLTGRVAPIDLELEKLGTLATRRKQLLQDAPNPPTLARRVKMLLADCETYGTIPFSILARYAFIAMTLVRSLRDVGIFSTAEFETLFRSIPTVASDLSRDLMLYTQSKLDTETLLQRYGHLRPSSYNITSPNYANGWQMYLSHSAKQTSEAAYPDPQTVAEIFDAHATETEWLLRSAGFTATPAQLRDFVLKSIPAREWSKFEFMKSVNAALESIAQMGERLQLSRDEMSYLPIEVVLETATNSASNAVRMEFVRHINFRQKRWSLTSAVRLPHLVRSVDEVLAFQVEKWTPNFISTKRVVAPPANLDADVRADSLEGKIVLIRAADPGYDWIFGHPISGLITQYGGAASHMAIRAAEFGLPAAIGCGETIFNRLREARIVELDCASKRLNPLQ